MPCLASSVRARYASCCDRVGLLKRLCCCDPPHNATSARTGENPVDRPIACVCQTEATTPSRGRVYADGIGGLRLSCTAATINLCMEATTAACLGSPARLTFSYVSASCALPVSPTWV